MLVNKHLLIHPSGKMEWVELHRVRRYDDIYCGEYAYDLDELHRVLGVSFFEYVSSVLPGIVFLIDEVGKIKTPPQPHNELASRLYGGYEFGDDIVGPALFFKQVGPNICPLNASDEARLSLFLGVELPEKLIMERFGSIMEYPWKVVGWENTLSEKGTKGVRLYIQSQLPEGTDGEGVASGRVWFNPEHVKYTPALGHQIIIIPDERNRNIVTRIIVVG